MKREWIVSIVAVCTLAVVLVLLSQVSFSQIMNCKSSDGSQPCTTNNNAHFNNGNNTGCTAAYTYISCDNIHKESHLTCTDIGCRDTCHCSCTDDPNAPDPNQKPGMKSSWVDECADPPVVRYNIETCNGCPTRPEDAEDDETCEAMGWYWNFTSNGCHTTPQTQVQCATADWYWNFTSNGCVPAPADGMCGGSPDWGNYPSTACYESGLGIFGGICNRSTAFISRCFQDNGDYDSHYCTCGGCDWCGGSPIVIDVNGNRYDMTDVSNGVSFDLNGNGTADKLSWTAPGSGSAWLAIDHNHNNMIDSGKELFGNFTFQPEPPAGIEKNGFRALAEYDKPENGGNGDGNIDAHDAVWSRLRLWQDANQNGISESAELHLLSEFGIESISLDYKESRHKDRYGNEFRYRAKVYGANQQDLGRWAYDVFLQSTK